MAAEPPRKRDKLFSRLRKALGGEEEEDPSTIVIGAPTGFSHDCHVGFNHKTGKFEGLPPAWVVMLGSSGLTEEEQSADPDALLSVMRYQDNLLNNGTTPPPPPPPSAPTRPPTLSQGP